MTQLPSILLKREKYFYTRFHDLSNELSILFGILVTKYLLLWFVSYVVLKYKMQWCQCSNFSQTDWNQSYYDNKGATISYICLCLYSPSFDGTNLTDVLILRETDSIILGDWKWKFSVNIWHQQISISLAIGKIW